MGRRKLPMQKLKNLRQRAVVKNKRRTGLFKKAVELALLCDQQIYMAVFDQEYNRMIEFLSDDGFTLEQVKAKRDVLKLNKNSKLSLRTFNSNHFLSNLSLARDGADEI